MAVDSLRLHHPARCSRSFWKRLPQRPSGSSRPLSPPIPFRFTTTAVRPHPAASFPSASPRPTFAALRSIQDLGSGCRRRRGPGWRRPDARSAPTHPPGSSRPPLRAAPSTDRPAASPPGAPAGRAAPARPQPRRPFRSSFLSSRRACASPAPAPGSVGQRGWELGTSRAAFLARAL